jgi:hypothetical protein
LASIPVAVVRVIARFVFGQLTIAAPGRHVFRVHHTGVDVSVTVAVTIRIAVCVTVCVTVCIAVRGNADPRLFLAGRNGKKSGKYDSKKKDTKRSQHVFFLHNRLT